MEETIIIYTKYYSEAVIEILDRYDLNIQVMCFSSYDKVLHYAEITPNLRGIIFLEYNVRSTNFKAYKAIISTVDEIAEASKQPFCVSVIANNDLPRKFIDQIPTSNLHVTFTKFMMFNTDLLRFEGLATVIVHTIGVANQSILLELHKDEGLTRTSTSSNKVDFLRYCLQITTVDKDELIKFEDAVKRFPELDKLIQLRTHSASDNDILGNSQNLFKVFANQCIARRVQDEKNSVNFY